MENAKTTEFERGYAQGQRDSGRLVLIGLAVIVIPYLVSRLF